MQVTCAFMSDSTHVRSEKAIDVHTFHHTHSDGALQGARRRDDRGRSVPFTHLRARGERAGESPAAANRPPAPLCPHRIHSLCVCALTQLAGVHATTATTLPDGSFDLDQLDSKIRHGYPDPHYPRTRLICVENTHNIKGGRVLPLTFLQEVCVCAYVTLILLTSHRTITDLFPSPRFVLWPIDLACQFTWTEPGL